MRKLCVNHKKLYFSIILVIFLAITLVFATPLSNAKSVGTEVGTSATTAKNFCFDSPKLTTPSTVALYGGEAHTFSFEVNNFLDSLNVTSSDITYTLSAVSSDAD